LAGGIFNNINNWYLAQRSFQLYSNRLSGWDKSFDPSLGISGENKKLIAKS
jgi:hypothetical protein